MFQFRLFACFTVITFVCVAARPASAQDDAVAKQLSVQSAMNRARALLAEMNSQKAVDVLEEQLAKVNGNPQYLVLLREAYRANIRDLYLKGQPVEAKRYFERLTILDPAATKDVALLSQAAATSGSAAPPSFRMYCPSAGKENQELSPSETFVKLSVGFFSSILKRFGLQAANRTRSSDLLSDSTCCAPLALDSVTIDSSKR